MAPQPEPKTTMRVRGKPLGVCVSASCSHQHGMCYKVPESCVMSVSTTCNAGLIELVHLLCLIPTILLHVAAIAASCIAAPFRLQHGRQTAGSYAAE